MNKITSSSLAVISEAFLKGAEVMVPLFSGGHDSLSAVYVASLHPKFDGSVYHIDTGIGAKATRGFVEEVAARYDWTLKVYKSKSTFERFVRERGFPGPGMHQRAYIRLKDRCVREICTSHSRSVMNSTGGIKRKAGKVALITGCRSQESVRRMGNVAPLKIGEPGKAGIANRNRYWVAPCHDWSQADQAAFMEHYDLPRNPIKQTPIGMSGECFCGAFARPNEIAMIRKYAPDVAEEIDRLTQIATECGKHNTWGTRPDRKKGIVVAQTGPLCSSCDVRAMAAGIVVDQCL